MVHSWFVRQGAAPANKKAVQVARKAGKIKWVNAGFPCRTLEGLEHDVFDFGPSWEETRGWADGRLWPSKADILDCLQSGWPILASYGPKKSKKPSANHSVVVIGIEGDRIRYADPADGDILTCCHGKPGPGEEELYWYEFFRAVPAKGKQEKVPLGIPFYNFNIYYF